MKFDSTGILLRIRLGSLVLVAVSISTASSFVLLVSGNPSNSHHRWVPALFESKGDDAEPSSAASLVGPPTNQVVQTVAVTGATGRTGSLVVQELLDRQVNVVAMVRSAEKAKKVFGDENDPSFHPLLKVIPCDLTDEARIAEAVQGCDAAIWCATGFSDARVPALERIKRLFKIAVTPKQSIDFVGVPLLAKAMLNQVVGRETMETPKVVMLSSAGVTRPTWEEEKKQLYRGCVEIPIVRLNPFGILNVKAESEEKLRESGTYKCKCGCGSLCWRKQFL